MKMRRVVPVAFFVEERNEQPVQPYKSSALSHSSPRPDRLAQPAAPIKKPPQGFRAKGGSGAALLGANPLARRLVDWDREVVERFGSKIDLPRPNDGAERGAGF